MKLRTKSVLVSVVPVILLSASLIITQYRVFSGFRDDVLYVQANELYQSAIAILDNQDRVLTETLTFLSRQEADFGRKILRSMINNYPGEFVLTDFEQNIVAPRVPPRWAVELLESGSTRAQLSSAIDNGRSRITFSEERDSFREQDMFPDIRRARILYRNELILFQRIDMSSARLSIRFFIEQSEKEIQSLTGQAGSIVIIFSILLSGIFTFLMVHLYLAPIKNLKRIVDDMSLSKSGLRWKNKGGDEFDELGTAFNSMADSLLNYQKQLETLISLRLSELEEARRHAAFGSMMAAGIAHDIKGPLGSVNTSLTFIEDQLKSVDTAYRSDSLKSSELELFLDRAKEGIRLALSSLTKAIDLSRSFKDVVADQVKGEIRSISLRPYIDDVIMSYRPRLRETGVTVECDIPADLTVTCDPGALSQILINLMENSLVHGFPEGYVPERLKGEGPWKPVIFIGAESVGGNIEIEYRDNGIGLSPEARERMFEKMYTTRKEEGGTGYGMMMIHEIVHNRLDGEIRFIDAGNSGESGVNFIITLPLTKN